MIDAKNYSSVFQLLLLIFGPGFRQGPQVSGSRFQAFFCATLFVLFTDAIHCITELPGAEEVHGCAPTPEALSHCVAGRPSASSLAIRPVYTGFFYCSRFF